MINFFYLLLGIVLAIFGIRIKRKVCFVFDLGQEYNGLDGEKIAKMVGSNIFYTGLFISLITLLRIVLDIKFFLLMLGIISIIYFFSVKTVLSVKKQKYIIKTQQNTSNRYINNY